MLVKYAVPDELMKKLIALGLTEAVAMEKIASGDAEEFIKLAAKKQEEAK